MKKILLVEDEKNIVDAVVYYIEQYYNIDIARTKKEALEKINNYYDLAILDINLPDGNSFEFSNKFKCPIIFLTASSDEDTIVKGLQQAEEYITKPFKNKELLLRIEKVLKRNITNFLIYKNITMDILSNKVTVNNKIISLAALDFKILEILLINAEKIISRDKLANVIYDNTGNFVEDNTLSVYIKRLRDKLGVDCIKTIKKVGYKLEED